MYKPRRATARAYTLSVRELKALRHMQDMLEAVSHGLIDDVKYAHKPLRMSRGALGNCFGYYAKQLCDVLDGIEYPVDSVAGFRRGKQSRQS